LKQLHDSIDIGTWLAVPKPKALSASPRVAIVEGFTSRELCDWLIERARPRMERATTYDSNTGATHSDQSRTNSHCYFRMAESDLLLHFLRARIAQVTGAPVGALEHSAMLHYRAGEQFFPHFDYLDPSLPGYQEELREGGQRTLTLLVYMNEGFEGGETHFPTAGQRYKGKKGDALFFWNVDWNGAPDQRTLHAGLPPTSGEKWLLSQWIRDRSVIPERF
jgi:prolyl 4-hydroxylase